jgi:hypothetical protein
MAGEKFVEHLRSLRCVVCCLCAAAHRNRDRLRPQSPYVRRRTEPVVIRE